MVRRRRAIQARTPALLPESRSGFYQPQPVTPRGTRARHERLLPNDVCPCGTGLKFKRCHRDAPAEEIAALGDSATLDHALNAARPLLIDPDVEGYPLIRSGTCFLTTYRGDLWVISSRHAFTNQGASPHQARVLRSVDEKRPTFIRLVEQLEPLDQDDDDTAWRDFVLIRSSTALPRWMRLMDLERAPLPSFEEATSEDWVRVCGFPNVLDNGVLYPERNIRVGRASIDGRYAGRTESKFVHSIRFPSTGIVTTLNGMSGGPIFFTKGAAEPWCFGGILLSEGVPGAGLARFVEARAIEKTLRWHYDANPKRWKPDDSR